MDMKKIQGHDVLFRSLQRNSPMRNDCKINQVNLVVVRVQEDDKTLKWDKTLKPHELPSQTFVKF